LEQCPPEDSDPRANASTDQPGDGRSDRWGSLERRQNGDRREQPTSIWDSIASARRRRHGRRAGEQEGTYVDRFHRRDVVLLVVIFVLNIFDALFTLLWLQRGGGEGNPFMAWMLEVGDWAFLAQKCFVVGVWLLLLIAHKNFRLARLGLWSAASLYSLLLLYHFALITSGVEPSSGGWDPDAARLEQTREQGGDRGLDPQWARPQAHSAKPGGV